MQKNSHTAPGEGGWTCVCQKMLRACPHSPSDASNEKNGKKAYQEKQGQWSPASEWGEPGTERPALAWRSLAMVLRGSCAGWPASLLPSWLPSGWEALWLCSGCVCSSETGLGSSETCHSERSRDLRPGLQSGVCSVGGGWCDAGLLLADAEPAAMGSWECMFPACGLSSSLVRLRWKAHSSVRTLSLTDMVLFPE